MALGEGGGEGRGEERRGEGRKWTRKHKDGNIWSGRPEMALVSPAHQPDASRNNYAPLSIPNGRRRSRIQNSKMDASELSIELHYYHYYCNNMNGRGKSVATPPLILPVNSTRIGDATNAICRERQRGRRWLSIAIQLVNGGWGGVGEFPRFTAGWRDLFLRDRCPVNRKQQKWNEAKQMAVKCWAILYMALQYKTRKKERKIYII